MQVSQSPVATAVASTMPPADVELPPVRVSQPEPELSVLSDEMAAGLTDAGHRFETSHRARKDAIEDVLRALGDAPPYGVWMAARAAIVAGYVQLKPNSTTDARDKFWSRFMRAVVDYCAEDGVEFTVPQKPAAQTPAAATMRKARENPYKGKSADAIEVERKAIGEKIAAGDVSSETATAYRHAVNAEISARKDAERAAKKAADDVLKSRRDKIVEALKPLSGEGLAVLEAVFHTMSADDKVSASGRAVLQSFIEQFSPKASEPAKGKRAK